MRNPSCGSISKHETPLPKAPGAMLILSLMLHGCISAPPEMIEAPSPIAAEPMPTSTFSFPTIPPTSTHTPMPIPTPTADPPAILGEILFEDDFSRQGGWDLPQTEWGAISLTSDRLVIAVRRPNRLLFTYNPQIRLADFYLEVDARSDLCSGADAYGILFRMNDALEHYRFVVTCDGEARLTRVLSSEARALIPLTESDSLILGPMAVNRLSIWAFGNTFRFQVNDVEIFTLRDTILPEGMIGFFVQSSNSNQVTIAFDDLEIWSLKPIPAAIPTPTP